MKKPQKYIAPSLLSADFSRLGEEVRAAEQAGADWIHLDIMDGHFVPTLTMGPLVVAALRKHTKLPFDVHLMVSDADSMLDAFIDAGANWITVHEEACPHLDRTLAAIRARGVKAGVALNPSTPVSTLSCVIDSLDYVLIMSVNPGFGGQSFIPYTLDKVRELVRLRESRNLNFLIQIDGGVKIDNIAEISQAGVDVFVAGSAIFGTKDYAKTIGEMKARC